MPDAYEFPATVWLHPAMGGWHFVSLPPDVADQIDDATAGARGGFGSVRVSVTIGVTTWQTSIFPDAKAGTFVLPMKKAVRQAEHVTAGDTVHARLTVLGR